IVNGKFVGCGGWGWDGRTGGTATLCTLFRGQLAQEAAGLAGVLALAAADVGWAVLEVGHYFLAKAAGFAGVAELGADFGELHLRGEVGVAGEVFFVELAGLGQGPKRALAAGGFPEQVLVVVRAVVGQDGFEQGERLGGAALGGETVAEAGARIGELGVLGEGLAVVALGVGEAFLPPEGV